jgi:hypothetical protein
VLEYSGLSSIKSKHFLAADTCQYIAALMKRFPQESAALIADIDEEFKTPERNVTVLPCSAAIFPALTPLPNTCPSGISSGSKNISPISLHHESCVSLLSNQINP